jgi:magnesium transporter
MAEELDTIQNDMSALLEQIEAGVLTGDALTALLAELHPADVADLMEELSPEKATELLRRLSLADRADVLEYVEEEEGAEIANRLPDAELVDILDEMSADDAADLLGDLDPSRAERLLREMDEEENVRSLLNYPEDSAGGLMVPLAFHLRDTLSVAQVLTILRELQPDPELIFYLFVQDAQDRLVGQVSIRHLVIHPTDRLIRDIMDEEVISVKVLDDQATCARLAQQYSLVALPVVDDELHLLGIITVDDLVDVVAEEAQEDTLLLGGLSGEAEVYDTIPAAVRKRLPWLVVNLGTAFMAASIIGLFEATIAQFTILALFQSIVAGQGGNAGTQTLTLVVRGLGTGEITIRDAIDLLRREAVVGIIQGVSVGILLAGIAYLWKGDLTISLVLAVAMLGNMIMANIAGVFIPMVLEKVKVDPAIASGVFVTTVTDMCGFFFFLGLATLVLM